ncbi:MAG: class I SAM-dependent RNA methyltransferase [Rhizomicrobium sp.]
MALETVDDRARDKSLLCRHFGTCGGCKYQDVTAPHYLVLKQEQVVRALERHGLGDVSVDLPLAVSPATRRRAALKAAKRGSAVAIGFRAARSHNIVDMQECQVLTPALAASVQALRPVMDGLLREGEEAELLLTEAENGIDVALNGKRGADATLAQWGARNRVARIAVNGELAMQSTEPVIRLAGIEVRLPPGAFLQPTREGEALLQECVRESMKGAARITDLFAGLGTFALALAGAARVHAVDSNASALSALQAAARRTAKLKPVTIEHRDLFRQPLQPKELDAFQGVVLDPPRAGALAQVRALALSGVGRAAYVSCNPESFARDARILVEGGFRIRRVAPVDQFLWSSHIELVAHFERR